MCVIYFLSRSDNAAFAFTIYACIISQYSAQFLWLRSPREELCLSKPSIERINRLKAHLVEEIQAERTCVFLIYFNCSHIHVQ
ncbi:hypothetical protein GYMLUDRAFT_46550 [Collybiopsis luxurians FD-317 M1]|uniref:Uncharacterized protein n=1 Tax=Collybiopsis luxurians FD-317 M1 TaxID=944289 RepID=A0A0D0CPK7_9AGAR|nr:hypothetical protein GYMLUDRAFT_46550 [Collybiopsis luxurians FD-317 M1]